MRFKKQAVIVVLITSIVVLIQCSKPFEKENADQVINEQPTKAESKNKSLVEQGKQIFRFDTFGDEDFWSGLLHIDKAILGMNNGGFGNGVSPVDALNVGLKVDVNALPPEVVAQIESGDIKLTDPASTVALLRLNEVVGIK